MRTLILAALLTLFALPVLAAGEPKTDDQKTLYAVGLALSHEIAVFDLSADELECVKQGLSDGITGKTPQVDLNAYKAKVQALAMARRDAEGVKLAAGSHAFLEQAAKEKGAVKTASGLVYLPLKEGTGAKPAASDSVKVDYRGTFVNGKEFGSSAAAGKPIVIKLNQVIKCWSEGVQLMKVGGKAKLVCPPDLAYGERGSGATIPPNATLVLEVDLVDVVK